MPRAIELDCNGSMILTDGIACLPLPEQLALTDLRPGDILVWYSSSRSRISSLIREFSGGPYSHVGIYIGNKESVDAGPEGVVRSSIQIPGGGSYVQVMRKKDLTLAQQNKVVQMAIQFDGYHYAWLDAITLPLRRRAYFQRYSISHKGDWFTGRALLAKLGNGLTWLRRRQIHTKTKKTFCSQIIVDAYAAINYFPAELAAEGVFTPNDLAIETFFEHKGWLCNTTAPNWHPLDPYSPEPVYQRKWRFSMARIFRGTSTGSK